MSEINEITCTLLIPEKIYLELSKDVKEFFVLQNGYYAVQFPADAEGDTYLGEYIKTFCEVILIKNNPKYEIVDGCTISTELFTIGPSEKEFSLLLNIKYPSSEKLFNDILYFKEVSQSLGFYTFELLGDQTLFKVGH